MTIYIALFTIGTLFIFFALGIKEENKYYIEIISTGFDRYVYIYKFVKFPILGRRKFYQIDGYSEGRKDFRNVEAAQEHIEKLLTPTTVKVISYP